MFFFKRWYDLDLILLQDTEKNTNLESYTQMIPIPFTIINVAKDDTVKDYEYKDTGFSVPVSHILGNNLQVCQRRKLSIIHKEKIN